jgi:hypothetical protein
VIEAANTNASPAGIWAIVIVAVLALAFWLSAIFLADRSQVRASGRSRAALSGAWVGASVPGPRVAEAPQGEVPTRTDIPAQPTAAGEHAMPRQRAGDADRAERSYAGRDTPDDEEPGR